MRAEDIVGISFFLVLFLGIGLLIYAQKAGLSPEAQHRRVGDGLIVGGVAFLFLGLISIYMIQTSARPVVEGNIWGISEPISSKYSPSFKVTNDSGQVTLIRCRYGGPGLRGGDRARVRYVEYNHELLEFKMLTGPYTGWSFEERPSQRGYALLAVLGAACGFCRVAPVAQACS
ncbi:MAG TPA: hypothetical protein VHU44_01910 [Acidobacteriaceae bacterium]|nr:hypothetical protein [Acidobacteriaceae bacterium]